VLVGGNGANEDVDGDVEDARAVVNDKNKQANLDSFVLKPASIVVKIFKSNKMHKRICFVICLIMLQEQSGKIGHVR